MGRFEELDALGLNLQAVLDVAALPASVQAGLGVPPDELVQYPRLLLIGHAGRALWPALKARGLHGSDPLDTFVKEQVGAWLARQPGAPAWKFVFPGPAPVGLQALGEQAGWHHPSPFWVGVQAGWGSWYAYRAVVLVGEPWPLTPLKRTESPCLSCAAQPCVSACPAQALSGEPVHQRAGTGLQACVDFRLQPASPCADRCLARQACPVGAEHRYTDGQTAYHYLQSLPALRAWASQRRTA